METQVATSEANVLRKEIRSVQYSMYVNEDGITLVDVESIQYRIDKLKNMGEDVKEFERHIRTLLLTQLNGLKIQHQQAASPALDKLIKDTWEMLWPTKN